MPEPTPGRALFALLEPTLSAPRLRAYRNRGDSDLDVLARYEWNVCLSEALYPSLHALEIAFRNSLFNAIEREYANHYWLWNNPPISDPYDQDEVLRVQDKLQRRGLVAEPPRMIAELTFGFWTGFLDRRYEGHNATTRLWPKLLVEVFPHIPVRLRNRGDISRRFENIRRLRNRVSHHEPIWNWPDLLQEHAQILDALGWINPALAEATRGVDRFAAVHSQAFLNGLRARLEAQSLALYEAANPKT